MTALTAPTAPPPTSTDQAWFRHDVDGLRAVAILLVVAYHAGLPFSSAGFIGVDMFFVISGFLISRNLLREAETTGRVALGTFWSRRIRRLVPALALMVVTTLAAAWYVLPSYDLEPVSDQATAAALYVSNIHFAREANDYFGSDISTSPFLHTWSLGVEEQFYVVWPLLVAAACWSPARRRARSLAGRRSTIIALFCATFAVSMALNLVLTRDGSLWAFFGLPSRAWQFAAAGLLAAVPVPALLRRPAARTACALAGLALLLVAGVLIDETTPYPGLWAAAPVLATMLLIVAGSELGADEQPGPVTRLLALRPMQWVGRVSYSWYLWHWPAIVLLVAWRGEESVAIKSAAALASLPVGWLAYRYFETPLRFHPILVRRHWRTFALGGAATAVALLGSMLVRPATPEVVAAVDDGATLEEAVAALEAPPGSSLQERLDTAVRLYRQRGDTDCPKVGAVETADGDKYCVGGDPDGARSLLLLGDSHAGQWRPALDAITREMGIRLLIRQGAGCPPSRVRVTGAERGNEATVICERIAEGNRRVIEALDPDAVIVSSWSGDRADFIDASGQPLDDPGEQSAAWEAGTEELLELILSSGAGLGFILDEPTLPVHAAQCLSRENDIAACETSAADALETSGPVLEAERRVLERLGDDVVALDAMAMVCDDRTCHLEIDGTLTYVDTHHFSDAFAMKQRPLLEDMVSRLFDAGSAREAADSAP